jgi:Fur family ferric uptake transcriptional regulator
MSRVLQRRQSTLPIVVTQLAERMSLAGYKVTEPRLAVLEAIVAYDAPFTAAALEHDLAARERSPGGASIFRSLKLLTCLGIVRRVHGITECHHYMLADGHARLWSISRHCGR